MAEFTNTLQKWVKQNTRLGIPVAVSRGVPARPRCAERNSYPQAIALLSTWDVIWYMRCSRRPPRRCGPRRLHHCLTPVLDLARDPRWGRTEETYGEDPYLVSHIGRGGDPGFSRQFGP